MSEREPLKNSILLRRVKGSGLEEFTIHGLINEGSSVLCYDASFAGGRGILKEFYPEFCASVLCRDSSGHLIPTGNDDSFLCKYENERIRYLRPYEILIKLRKNCTDGELDNFIPVFEVFEGCADDGKPCGTIYIWLPQKRVRTFQSLLEDEELNGRPEDKLYLILKIIQRLTSCICRLHSEKLIHRDINPRNFGITMQNGQVLTDHLSLFDLNTISYIYDEDHAAVGTEGYIERYAGILPFNESTDIYSIGATLFSAVVITEKTKQNKQLYYDRYYGNLKTMVAESELIHQSAKNSCYEICDILVTILQQCLAPRGLRYQSCEQLNEDLLKALTVWERLGSLDQVCLNAKKKEEKCSSADMLFHFYRKPLYGKKNPSDNQLRVLLLGFSGYSWKYLDALLQMAQMVDKKLFVTIVAENLDLFRTYNSKRPALEKFFDVEGSLFGADEVDVYGHITVKDARTYTKCNGNPFLDRGVISGLMKDNNPHRVFISLENDAQNITATNLCGSPTECMISYASTDEALSESSDGPVPVPVTRSLKDTREYTELKRMAFNAHLVWEKDLLSINEEMIEEFNSRSRYFSDASISNVISVRYKLFMAGVNLDKRDMTHYKAAELFQQKMKEDKTVRNLLIWTEHRRWVAEKVCQGWKCLNDLEKCPIGNTKLTGDKLHICLVRSRLDSKLSDLVSADLAKWDSLTDEEYLSLDELDRLSVDLHRKYKARAEAISPTSLLRSTTLSSIAELAKENQKVNSAYQEWLSCVKSIVIGEKKQYGRYRQLTNSLKNICRCYYPNALNELKRLLASFNEKFTPVHEACHFLNLKNNDADLVDGIPFILTYNNKLKLVIPYVTGSFSLMFENVAAATVINPEQIKYLFISEDESRLTELYESLPRIASYAEKKGLRAKFALILFLGDSLYENQTAIREELSVKSGGLLSSNQIKCHRLKDKTPLPKRIIHMLKSAGKGYSVVLQHFDSRFNGMSGILSGSGVYDAVEHFSFDSFSQTFSDFSPKCAVKYVTQRAEMSVGDMMSFGLSLSSSGIQPEFYPDYKLLWDKYKTNRNTWKCLCGMLEKHDKKAGIIARFNLESNGRSVTKIYKLPENCCDVVVKILDGLKEFGIIDKNSDIRCVSDFCQITIYCIQSQENILDTLFKKKVTSIRSPEDLSCYMAYDRDNSNQPFVAVKTDELQVNGFAYEPKWSDYFDDYNALLKFWEKKCYIYNLDTKNSSSISFCYASHNLKKLLTCAGKMLEVYVFQKLREQTDFDNVVSGCEINWGSDFRNLNEMDCVVTKGFRSVFIECKSTELKADYYYKLDSLVKTLGINAIPVIIDDKQESDADAGINRGNDMAIRTITDLNEIDNIGKTILKLLKD